jgi:2-polyprenyl-6-hydroxyphenyl methylase/3-demethylubiquinone-9 3-methyltransferase
MRKISQSIYGRLDNAVYSAQSEQWWQPDSAFYQMRIFLDPVRVEYAKRVLIEEARIDPKATAALDVGSGGGFLAEEIARMGFDTTGVDPSAVRPGRRLPCARERLERPVPDGHG